MANILPIDCLQIGIKPIIRIHLGKVCCDLWIKPKPGVRMVIGYFFKSSLWYLMYHSSCRPHSFLWPTLKIDCKF